jgi:hypothetical protein
LIELFGMTQTLGELDRDANRGAAPFCPPRRLTRKRRRLTLRGGFGG